MDDIEISSDSNREYWDEENSNEVNSNEYNSNEENSNEGNTDEENQKLQLTIIKNTKKDSNKKHVKNKCFL